MTESSEDQTTGAIDRPQPAEEGFVPNSARGRATRARLLKAAEECFGSSGYAGASVSEIVRLAGTSQGGFYVYFPSKEAIFRQLVLNIAQQIRAVTRQALEGVEHRADAELAGMEAFFGWLTEHRHLHRVLHQIDEVDESLAREFYMSVSEPYSERLAAAVADDDVQAVDPELLAYSLMGLSHFVSMRWILWTEQEFPERLLPDLQRIVGGMLRGAAGS
jgi:AcrR family transcriptional regulator